jgi:hypothetical protein
MRLSIDRQARLKGAGMNIGEIKEILSTIKYKDYIFDVLKKDITLYLQARYLEADVITNQPTWQYTRKWQLSEHMVKSEIVQTALKCVLTSAEHRVREHFLYKGERIFGPHFDVDGLWQLCRDKRLDYRGRKRRNKMSEVFLGGTCNDSQWREELKPLLSVDYFDPVVKEWNEEAQQREIEKRQTCDFVLYTLTPRMAGVYAVAEVVDDSNKRPDKTLLCVLNSDGMLEFDQVQAKSLKAVAKLVASNGCAVFDDLTDVAIYLNERAPQSATA